MFTIFSSVQYHYQCKLCMQMITGDIDNVFEHRRTAHACDKATQYDLNVLSESDVDIIELSDSSPKKTSSDAEDETSEKRSVPKLSRLPDTTEQNTPPARAPLIPHARLPAMFFHQASHVIPPAMRLMSAAVVARRQQEMHIARQQWQAQQEMRQQQETHRQSTTTDNIVCAVCGDRAKSTRYGVHTCQSCTLFFWHAAVRQRGLSYTCNNNKKCNITKITRGNCSYCRYQKCVQLGCKVTSEHIEEHEGASLKRTVSPMTTEMEKISDTKRKKRREERMQLLQETSTNERSESERKKSPIVDVDESELAIEHVDEPELSIVQTEEDAPATLLREGGYTYKFERRSDDKLHYNCAKADRCGCEATITTDGREIINGSCAHNHEPDQTPKLSLSDSSPSNSQLTIASSQ